MADLRIIQGGKDDSENTTPEVKKSTVVDMRKKNLTEQEQKVLLLRGKVKSSPDNVLEFVDPNQRTVTREEVPRITTIREIERRAMEVIAQRENPNNADK
ncbi:MAG: hypothetical protein Q8P62_02760 [Candidatus Peregrinibacteria bacterium]|nr:hypothetical protein [Candidatus Peregrinibacteria bacterium]